MTERRDTDTGPVVLPDDPTKAAQKRVGQLASLGTLHKPPTEREYEHAAIDVALTGASADEVYAVLVHLGDRELLAFGDAIEWTRNATVALLQERGYAL